MELLAETQPLDQWYIGVIHQAGPNPIPLGLPFPSKKYPVQGMNFLIAILRMFSILVSSALFLQRFQSQSWALKPPQSIPILHFFPLL